MRLSEPLAAADFAALMAPFAPFESRPELAVAVSGGRDSLALALLAHEWASERGGAVMGLIVDHGLRAEAAAEAKTTAGVLAHHGIEAEILKWAGAKPARGLQEAARAARYCLLFEACRRRGILHLLVAHHADDQNETVAMRSARDSGPDGLAGMAAVVEHANVRLLRPLLATPRARLTATLQARGIAWIEDPSNSDPRFERARLREGVVGEASRTAASERSQREATVAKEAVDLLEIEPDGRVALHGAPSVRLLSRLIQALGGRDHPPRRARLERAASRLRHAGDRGKSGKGQDFTLSGCRLVLRRAPKAGRMRWIVGPENGKNSRKNGGQPLIPAAFSACGAP